MLCDKIWEVFEDVKADMERLDRDPPIAITRKLKIRNILNNERLRKAEQKLRNPGVHDDGYTPMQFLRVARHTFASSNKKYFKQLQESIEEDPNLGGEVVSEEEEEVSYLWNVDLLLTTSCQ